MRTRGRILAVDDHADMCGLITAILEGYEVVSAHSKAEALRKAARNLFDLYLLDYHMPDGTGMELCLLIRNIDQVTPILFVTNSHSLTKEEIAAAGADGLVSKDDLPDGLLSSVCRVLETPDILRPR